MNLNVVVDVPAAGGPLPPGQRDRIGLLPLETLKPTHWQGCSS
jgi:hypothetical protein